MALDFPSNPINGQTYDNYYWDASSNAWRSSGTKAGLQPRVTALELANATTNKSGLVPITSMAINNVASVSLDNVFSSTYDNYKIMYRQYGAGTSADLYIRGRINGVETNGGWYTGLIGTGYNGGSPSYKFGANTAYAIVGGTTNPQGGRSFVSADIMTPYLAAATQISVASFVPDNGLNGYSMELNAHQYTGFTFGVTGSTISGKIFVYGYRN